MREEGDDGQRINLKETQELVRCGEGPCERFQELSSEDHSRRGHHLALAALLCSKSLGSGRHSLVSSPSPFECASTCFLCVSRFYLTERAYNAVLQKSIPSHIRQLILEISDSKQ
jgi:hypothetical protein